ncbi:hypothetical protein LTR53_006424 [Teratosphaeriaceae sp. CCFEE 6253]|nr:hypothetical protein LTR53_006424 [Teratosphaeriaceae sp. CCFEE 6253]
MTICRPRRHILASQEHADLDVPGSSSPRDPGSLQSRLLQSIDAPPVLGSVLLIIIIIIIIISIESATHPASAPPGRGWLRERAAAPKVWLTAMKTQSKQPPPGLESDPRARNFECRRGFVKGQAPLPLLGQTDRVVSRAARVVPTRPTHAVRIRADWAGKSATSHQGPGTATASSSVCRIRVLRRGSRSRRAWESAAKTQDPDFDVMEPTPSLRDDVEVT